MNHYESRTKENKTLSSSSCYTNEQSSRLSEVWGKRKKETVEEDSKGLEEVI
jgi:hypothetical protein